jgi:protein required for attachment to host cells
MDNACVVVANGSRARIFFLIQGGTSIEPTARLQEVDDLVNPVQRMPDREVFSEPHPGVRTHPGGLRPQPLTDHRDQHDAEFERRFARLVADKVVQISRDKAATRVVLAAETRMLGHLRKELPPKLEIELDTVGKDLTLLTGTELHDHLAESGMLPARHDRLSVGRTARGRVG